MSSGSMFITPPAYVEAIKRLKPPVYPVIVIGTAYRYRIELGKVVDVIMLSLKKSIVPSVDWTIRTSCSIIDNVPPTEPKYLILILPEYVPPDNLVITFVFTKPFNGSVVPLKLVVNTSDPISYYVAIELFLQEENDIYYIPIY